MKIAIASDDKVTISHHFGRASGFIVCEIKVDKVVSKGYRENIGKSSGVCGSCDHSAMVSNVKDCQFVISYGMGQKIYTDLTNSGITPIVTEEKTVDAAIQKFLDKQLKNRTDKLH